MGEDHSLDEFVGAGSEKSDGADVAGGDGTDGDETDLGDDPAAPATDAVDPASDAVDPASDAVDPATATSAWAGDGGECERCDGTAARRWNDDGEFVCPDCKEW